MQNQQVNHESLFRVQGWKAITLCVALVGSLALSACQRVPAATKEVSVTAQAEVKAKRKFKHVCGAKTRDGQACQHPVKQAGELCWVHKPIVPCTTDADCEEKNGR